MWMSCENPSPLLVAVPVLGGISETFVRRHVYDITSGVPCALSLRVHSGSLHGWDPPERTYLLERSRSLFGKAASRFFRLAVSAAIVRARVQRFARLYDVQSVLSEYLDFTTSILPVVRSPQFHIVAHGHGYDVSNRLRSKKWIRRYRRMNDFVHDFVVVSELSKTRLRAVGITKPISVIPCGVDPPPVWNKREVNRDFRALFVGRLTAKKGPIETITAFALAHLPDGASLEIIGDGPLREPCEQLIDDLSLRDRVHFRGFVHPNEVQEAMQNSDVFLQHNRVDPVSGDEEGLPVAILEAMGWGMTVISTNHAGIPEAIIHENCGLLSDEGDIEKMADNLMRAYQDSSLRESLGRTAWERCHEHFSADSEISRLREVLRLE